MEWMLMPFKRYADFSGRSRRQEFWMFQLFILLVYIAFIILMGLAGGLSGDGSGGGILATIFSILFLIFALGIFIPSLALTVRRLHDLDKSGWMILIGLIPLIGSILLLVWYCTQGTNGPNRFGDDPLGAANLGDVFS
jgi:uncharacterized membrane protein YhaH (DUF805 family)